MTETHPRTAFPKRRQPRHLVAYSCAVGVLIFGFIIAGAVYVFAPDDSDAEAAADIANARMYQHNLEVVGGKFAVYLDKFNHWFASLWHGRTLAFTIAVLAIVIAVVCIRVGDLMSRLPDDDDH